MPMPRMTRERWLERFAARTDRSDPNGCWPWLGYTQMLGSPGYQIRYGVVTWGKRPDQKMLAHRAALIIADGLVPRDLDQLRGLKTPEPYALHGCDNGICVRVGPKHVHWGTAARNSQEMVERQRMNFSNRVHGERINTAKLTAEQVRLMRALDDGSVEGRKALASLFGVTYRAVIFVVTRQHWKHIP